MAQISLVFFFISLLKARNYPRQRLLSNIVANIQYTNHILHNLTGSIATPVAKDVHPKIILIPLELLQSPSSVQVESILGDDPHLSRFCDYISIAYTILVYSTPFASNTTNAHPSLPIRVPRNLGILDCRGCLFLGGKSLCTGGCLASYVGEVHYTCVEFSLQFCPWPSDEARRSHLTSFSPSQWRLSSPQARHQH